MRSFFLALALLVLSTLPSLAAGSMCGGFTNTTCGPTEWCSYSADNVCGIADGTGICKPRPEVCTQQYMPVCGCDGQTYSNACTAHAAGASIAYVGTCRMNSSGSTNSTVTATSTTECIQVVSCGTKNGMRKEYPTPCAAAEDGATNISPKTGPSCEVTQ